MVYALLSLAALPFVAQAITFPVDNQMRQEPGLLRYPITVSSRNPSTHGNLRRQQEVGIHAQQSGFFYSIELQVGTPPQPVSVNFDTGSAELWINPVCSKSSDPASCQKYGRFNGSQTYVDTNVTNRIKYGTGFAQLEYGYDYVQIGSARLSQQIFGVATDSEFAVVGIMGAGPRLKGWTSDYPMVLDNMVSQKHINSRAFSLDIRSIESARGSVVFGGIDTKKFSGALEKRPIIPAAESPDKLTRYWVYLDGISVTKNDGSKTEVFDQVNGQPVLFDSGYTVSALSTNYFNKIKDAFPGVTPPPADDDSGLYRVPCSVSEQKGTVNFKFGKTEINVPYNDFIWKQSPDLCVLGVVPDDKFPVLGDTFLRAAYVVYDMDNRNIHVANNEDCGSALVPIGKGPNAVPSIEGACGKSNATSSSTKSATTSTTSTTITTTTKNTTTMTTTTATSATTPRVFPSGNNSTSSSTQPAATSTTTARMSRVFPASNNSTASSTQPAATPTTSAPISRGFPIARNSTTSSTQPATSSAKSPLFPFGNSTTATSSASVTGNNAVITSTSKPFPTAAWANGTNSYATLTSTYLTTRVHTITSCPAYVKDCPVGHVTTETVIATKTWCPGKESGLSTPELPATTPPITTPEPLIPSQQVITSVMVTTNIHTITSCAGDGPCHHGRVTTEVVTATRYVCPQYKGTFTMTREHICDKNEPGCKPGENVVNVNVLKVAPHTMVDEVKPVPGCGNCVMPPPVPVPTQPPIVGQTTTVLASTTSIGTIQDLTTYIKPSDSPCGTCALPTTSTSIPTAAAGSLRISVAVGAVMLGAALANVVL